MTRTINGKSTIEKSKLRVVVEVLGGVAECTQCPKGVIVEIIDHDNEKAGEWVKVKTQYTWDEAYLLLKSGTKIRRDSWLVNDYLYMDKGIIKDDGGNDFSDRLKKGGKWAIFNR